jgi:hypothetical protein
MTNINWTDRLSEYLDGTLTPDEVVVCEGWLASSAEGRALLQELRRVVAKAKTLPDVAVPEAVWSGISAGIRSSEVKDVTILPLEPSRRLAASAPRRWQFSPLQLAAAAAVLVAVGVGFGMILRERGNSTEVAGGPFGRPTVTTGTTVRPVNLPAAGADAGYDKAVQDLQLLLQRNRNTLDTATVRVLESSLARIDLALTEAREAVEKDPRNAYLNDHLSRIKRKKLDVLRQGASLVQAS